MITSIKRLNVAAALALVALGSSLTSCDNGLIYEDLDPCEVKHAVKFQWTRNMLGADGFSNNVHSVALYVFDENDKFVTMFSESGEKLAMQGYTLALDGLAPGRYTFVAWCGLENEGTRAESFTVDDCIQGVTSRQDLLCTMKRDIYNDGTHHSSEELYDLYHGTAYGVEIFDANNTDQLGDHVYTINLTKDTNAIAIQLVNLSGDDLDVSKFAFTIEETNGTLKPDNSLDEEDEMINYHEFETYSGDMELETRGFPVNPLTRAAMQTTTGGALLNVSRLIEDQHSYLTILNTETGEQVARIPMIDYALVGKKGDKDGRLMTDQEYLDSQDRYRLDFFLDKNGNWLSTSIMINNWTVYMQDVDMNN